MAKAKKTIQFNSKIGQDYLDSLNALRAEQPPMAIKISFSVQGDIPEDVLMRWANEAFEHEALITVKLEGTSAQKSHEFSHRLHSPQIPLPLQEPAEIAEAAEQSSNGHQDPANLEPTEEESAAALEEAAQAAAAETATPSGRGRRTRASAEQSEEATAAAE